MQKHTKKYFDYFNIAHNETGWHDFIHCEVCKSESVDIHHIHGRGKGKDTIENLIALCRPCHDAAHNESISKIALTIIHKQNLK